MKLLFLLGLVLASPTPIVAELNAYEVLMFFDMYRSDYEQNGPNAKIANGCTDCGLHDFISHIDRLNTFNAGARGVVNIKNPEVGDLRDWGSIDGFVYDARRLLGGLWRSEDTQSRPGHPTVIERLVGRLEELRQNGDPGRLDEIVHSMEWAHLSRRKSQAPDILSYMRDRLAKARLAIPRTQTISFINGDFNEFDSEATIRSVQITKRSALRNELMAIANDINSGSVSGSLGKRSLTTEQPPSKLGKRGVGDDMAITALQRGMDGLKMPPRRKC